MLSVANANAGRTVDGFSRSGGVAEMAEQRAVVTVLGVDRTGIVAAIATVLAEHGGNIEDIRMATMGELFTMIALVDLAGLRVDFVSLQEALAVSGSKLGVQASIQRREIFDAMHRI
jgi:ACT domain-containing protein